MIKRPRRVQKTKASLYIKGIKVNGLAYFDRWYENIWFATEKKIFTPVAVKRILKTMSVSDILNFHFKVIYSNQVQNLIPDGCTLLNRISKK